MLSDSLAKKCGVCYKQLDARNRANFCSYSCYRKYKLPSKLNRLSHSKAVDVMNRGISTRDKCKILLHPRESLKHFIVKSLVCRILFERGRSFVSEACVENGNKVDVCDLSMQIAYEIEPDRPESRLDSKFGKYGISPAIKDIIIIPYKKLPDDLNLAYDKLKDMVV